VGVVSALAPWRVVVAGGGVAGIEALLGLHALGEGRLELALVTPENHFTLRPHAVGEPFGGAPSPRLPLADVTREVGARFVRDRMTGLAPGGAAVGLEMGGDLSFDALIVTVGARTRDLHPRVLTFGGPMAVPAVRRLIGDLTHRRAASVAFVVPAGTTWPLPMYELALMTRGRAQRRRIVLITPEHAPLALFGPEPSRAVGELLENAGVELHTGAEPQISEDGTAVLLGGDAAAVEADRIVAAPLLDGPEIDGLPRDDAGFIPVDEHSRVPGLTRVYAAGDGTNQPIKQGGLAAQQADAAVRHLVAEAGGMLPAEPFRPVLRGRLLTGGVDRFLRHDPEGDDSVLDEPLWQPAAKVVGHYLAPWIAYRHPELARRAPAHGRPAVAGVHVDARLTDPSVLGLDPYGPLGGRGR
jgi:sulfide:quinone oxidoreductase